MFSFSLFPLSLLFASLHLPNVARNRKQTHSASALVYFLNPHDPSGTHLWNGCDWMPWCIPGDALGLRE